MGWLIRSAMLHAKVDSPKRVFHYQRLQEQLALAKAEAVHEPRPLLPLERSYAPPVLKR